jgi:hypothetical protein
MAQVRLPESPHAESLDDPPNKRIRVLRRNSLHSRGMDDRVARFRWALIVVGGALLLLFALNWRVVVFLGAVLIYGALHHN